MLAIPWRPGQFFPTHRARTCAWKVDGSRLLGVFLKRLPSFLAETARGWWPSVTGLPGLIWCLQQGARPGAQGEESQPPPTSAVFSSCTAHGFHNSAWGRGGGEERPS